MNIKTITLLSTALFLLVPASASADEPASSSDERPDEVRVRGGLSAGGGFAFVTASEASALAPVLAVSGRVGVQFNHLFSLYYQNMGAVAIASGPTVMFDYNSLLPNFTIAHRVDLGVGPSCDVVSVGGSNGGPSTTAAIPGMDVRLAINFAARTAEARRSGFSVGLDVHPSFGPGGVIVTTATGLGYEWF